MSIPILDLSDEMKAHWDEFMGAAEGVMKSTHFILGPNVGQFEKEVGAWLGVKHAIGCNSGTDALIIGLRALGIGAGDEVITSPFTFFATAEAVSLVGGTPVFVDIEPESFNLNVDLIEKYITPKTKAIIPVHLFGTSVDMAPLQALAKKHNLKVLEDVAQAMGSEYQGKKAGAIGDLGAFSFFPSKNLGAFGDGGLMTTNCDKAAEMCRMLRMHGSKKKYHNEMIGYNSRLDELQAAFLRVKLKYLAASNEGRRDAANRYRELLMSIPGVTPPMPSKDSTHVYHQYTIRVPAEKRDTLHTKLAENGVSTMIYYPVPLHKLPVYQGMKHTELPVTEQAAREVISLPIWPTISPETQVAVVAAIKSILEN